MWHHNGRPIMVKGYKINKLLRVSLVEGSGEGEALFIRAADKAYTGIIRLNLLCPRYDYKEREGEMGQQSGGLSIKRVKGRERSPLGQEREGGKARERRHFSPRDGQRLEKSGEGRRPGDEGGTFLRLPELNSSLLLSRYFPSSSAHLKFLDFLALSLNRAEERRKRRRTSYAHGRAF